MKKEKWYICKNCGLEFEQREITAEDEEERDLCPGCGKPFEESNEVQKQIEKMANEINEMSEPNAHYYDESFQDHEAFADCFTIAKYLVIEKGYRKQVQGEWKPVMQELNYCDTLECSVCEFVIDVSQGGYNYCPHCGAKMKGAEG